MATNINLCEVRFTPFHQLIFNSKQEQDSYFNRKVVVSFDNCKYQDRRGTMRVKGYVDNLHNCNYGFYTNTYKGATKRYYFWILEKNLIAKETTEFTIQLDVWQTWLFDITTPKCMIERMHVSDDTFGKHTFPEEFELGDYVSDKNTNATVTDMTGNVCYIIGITDSSDGLIGGVYDKIYTGFKLKYFSSSGTIDLTNYIISLCNAGKADSIAFIYTFPESLFIKEYGSSVSNGTFIPQGSSGCFRQIINVNPMNYIFSWNGELYEPHNNKCLCYPYNMLKLYAPNGNNVILKYEQFNNPLTQQKLMLEATLCQNPIFELVPLSYNGEQSAYKDAISLNGFPICSWNNDNYSNWLAQHENTLNQQSANALSMKSLGNSISYANYNTARENLSISNEAQFATLATNFMGNVLNPFKAVGNTATGAVNLNASNAIAQNSMANDLSNSLASTGQTYKNAIDMISAQIADSSVQPNTAKGDTTATGLDVARNTNTFFIEQVHIKPEFVKVIDSYFDMFGYKVNSIDNPITALNTRIRYNYIKTANCIVLGNVPQADREEIANFFNNGFTVWHNEDFLFDYTTKNNIK